MQYTTGSSRRGSVSIPNWFSSLKRGKKIKTNYGVTSKSAWDLRSLPVGIQKLVGYKER